MDNKNVDLYFVICFFIAGSITAFLGLVAVLFGLILVSILLIPLFVVASIIDTCKMISKGINKGLAFFIYKR
jgi:hypothetical protein